MVRPAIGVRAKVVELCFRVVVVERMLADYADSAVVVVDAVGVVDTIILVRHAVVVMVLGRANAVGIGNAHAAVLIVTLMLLSCRGRSMWQRGGPHVCVLMRTSRKALLGNLRGLDFWLDCTRKASTVMYSVGIATLRSCGIPVRLSGELRTSLPIISPSGSMELLLAHHRAHGIDRRSWRECLLSLRELYRRRLSTISTEAKSDIGTRGIAFPTATSKVQRWWAATLRVRVSVSSHDEFFGSIESGSPLACVGVLTGVAQIQVNRLKRVCGPTHRVLLLRMGVLIHIFIGIVGLERNTSVAKRVEQYSHCWVHGSIWEVIGEGLVMLIVIGALACRHAKGRNPVAGSKRVVDQEVVGLEMRV